MRIFWNPFFHSKCALLSSWNCPRDRAAKMSRYTCDITVFDKQTNMAEREGKPSKHGGQIARHPQVKQCGSKISVNHSHIRSPEQEKLGGASARATAMLSNTVTWQAQLSSPVSRDTFIWKLAVFWLQKNHPNYFSSHYPNISHLLHISRKENTFKKNCVI